MLYLIRYLKFVDLNVDYNGIFNLIYMDFIICIEIRINNLNSNCSNCLKEEFIIF